MASSVKNQLKRKTANAKNKNAKFKVKFSKYKYSSSINGNAKTSLAYSKTISKTSNLKYKE